MRHSSVVLLIGCATMATLIEMSAAETFCAHCVCLPSYSPVCGQMKDTGKMRGFSSRCLLECTNKCRKNKYEFVFNGRCGKAPKIAPPVPPPTVSPPMAMLMPKNLVGTVGYTTKKSSIQDDINTTPQMSSTQDDTNTTPQGSLIQDDINTIPQMSSTQDDTNTTPQGSLIQDDTNTTPQMSSTQDDTNTTPQGSLTQDDINTTPQ